MVVNPGENAAEGSLCIPGTCECLLFSFLFWVNPPKEEVCFFFSHQEIHTFILNWICCCLGEIELTREDFPNV